jgi:hypothetical protein
MPQAKRSTSSSSRARGFKEPAALKRFNRSIDTAEQALAELRKHAGREVSQTARDLYKDLRTFVSSARRHSGKFAKALQRDFERAEKSAGARTAARSGGSRSTAGSTSARRAARSATTTQRKQTGA